MITVVTAKKEEYPIPRSRIIQCKEQGIPKTNECATRRNTGLIIPKSNTDTFSGPRITPPVLIASKYDDRH